MSETEYKKPIPVPSDESRPYWQGLAAGKLLMPRCGDCGRWWFPPSLLCPSCNSARWTWTEAKGTGRIFSYVVYHRVYHEGFAGDVPYAVAVIELDEGARMLSNVVGMPPDQLKCDMRVEIVYERITDTVTLPKFRPLASAA